MNEFVLAVNSWLLVAVGLMLGAQRRQINELRSQIRRLEMLSARATTTTGGQRPPTGRTTDAAVPPKAADATPTAGRPVRPGLHAQRPVELKSRTGGGQTK